MDIKINPELLKFLFVFFQFGGIAILLISGPVFAQQILLLSVELIGIFIGMWAIFSMKIDNLRIFPDLKTGASLVQTGPYRLIRHPMYLAIIVTFIPLIISEFSLVRLLVFIIICLDLILKLNYEEKLLIKAFKDYPVYRKKTYRLLPFIY